MNVNPTNESVTGSSPAETSRTVSTPSSSTEHQVQAELQQELAKALGGDKTIEQLMEEAANPTAKTEAAAGGEASAEAGAEKPASSRITPNLVRGRITAVQGDDVFVELSGFGGKNQGIVPLIQFERPPRPGSIMEFVIQQTDEAQGLIHLSREGAATRATWDSLQKGSIVEARVVNTNKGGLELEMVGGIRAFMPASQIDIHHVDNLEQFVGQKITAVVHDVERRSKKVVISRRHYLEDQRERAQEKAWAELQVGELKDGKVSRVTEFGAFVDIGGVDGLIHVSDLSYSRVNNPAELLKVGQEIKVKILKLDAEKKRISLGLKQVAPDPWDGMDSQIKVGDVITGKVTRVADFGAFVEIRYGVEGLLPASEISWRRGQKISDAVKEGDSLRIMVLALDMAKRRVTLSLKQTGGNPWETAGEKYPKHGLAEGTVLSTTEFGAFVELEPGIEGLVHISELSDKRVTAVSDVVKVGEKHQFRILEVDTPNRRVRLSLKAVANLPAEETAKEGTAATAASGKPAAGKPAGRKKPGNLKSGLGDNAALGMGLGQLRL